MLQTLLEEIRAATSATGKAKLRRFGMTIGAVALLAGSLLWWRSAGAAPAVLGAGGLLLLLAALSPPALRPIHFIWMAAAAVLGFLMTRLILSLFYLVVFVPAGLVLRLLGKDPLHQRPDPDARSYWIDREDRENDPRRAEKQY